MEDYREDQLTEKVYKVQQIQSRGIGSVLFQIYSQTQTFVHSTRATVVLEFSLTRSSPLG